jgi:hypothetical protein
MEFKKLSTNLYQLLFQLQDMLPITSNGPTQTQLPEVLETGIKLNGITYKATEYFNLLAGYEFDETGMLNQTS